MIYIANRTLKPNGHISSQSVQTKSERIRSWGLEICIRGILE